VPIVDMSHEARRQFLSLPPAIADRFKELADLLRTNPHSLPPWSEVKSIGREGAKEVFRARVGKYRATYVFDGPVVRFTRFRRRKDIGYGSPPKV
jgi:mRNA-degrading endonuclease RelE of RelBE toxin-antitoxin system